MFSFNKFISALAVLAIGMGSMTAQRVFMTGDSHVFAKVYPNTIEELLKAKHEDVDFGYWAKNGICFYSFNNTPEYFDTIFKFQPDILIVHLGTNGAYDNNFTRQAFRQEMENFYSTLTDSVPNVKTIFVTPFTNKKRKYRKKGKWHVNYKNKDVAEEIKSFVNDHPGTYVIDNNESAGMKYLKTRGLIRPDNVHLTEEGYRMLGEEVGNEVLGIEEIWIIPEK